MDRERTQRAVLAVSAGYVILLALWIGWISGHTPPDTLPYQITGLLGVFGTGIGTSMLLARRPTRADRKLRRNGLEGWAVINDVHPIARTDHHSTLAELDLSLTVPGSDSYRGTVVYDVMPAESRRIAVGETISVRVDPVDRDRIILAP